METQPTTTVAESPTSNDTLPNLLEILAGGFSEVSDDSPLFI